MSSTTIEPSQDRLRRGYKQTLAGVIPVDWDVCSLIDAAEFLDEDRRPVKAVERAKVRGKFPYYGASGIVDWVNSYLFDGDFILLGEDGENILSRALPLAFRVSGKIWVNNHAHVLAPRPGFDIDFLAMYLESLTYGLYNTGTAQPKLNKKTCSAIPIAKPTHAEQRAIAEALGDVDALIAAQQKLIAKKRAIKTATMQRLLTGKQRLPGFGEGCGTKQTEIGVIPEDWEVVHAYEICAMKSGSSITAANIDDHSSHPCYGGNGLRGYTANYTHDGSFILIGRQGALCGNVTAVRGRFFASEHAIVVSTGSKAYIDWLTVVLESMNLNQYSESSAQPGLSVQKILELKTQYPVQLEEQHAIAQVLTDMDAEITVLEKRQAKTKDIKQGMMQELLTGRTRLV